MVEGAAARERRDRAAFTSIVAGGIGTWQEVRAGRGKVYLPSHDCLGAGAEQGGEGRAEVGGEGD